MKNDQINYFFKTLLGTELLVGLTSVISSLCSVAVNGRLLPSTVLAAISLTITINGVLKFAGDAVRQGSMVVFGRQMGQGNLKDIQAVVISSLITLTVFGMLMAGIVFLFPEKIAALAGAVPGEKGFSDVVDYFQGYIWGQVANMFVGFLLTLGQLKGKTRLIMLTTIELMVGSLSFALLNALCFGASAFGAGIAQSLAQIIPVIHLLVICIRDGSIPSLRVSNFSFRIMKEVLTIGVPLSAITFFQSFRNTIMNHILCNYGGMTALSAKAVYATIMKISEVFVAAVPAVAVIIAGVFVGERNKDALVNLFRRAFKLTILFSLADMIMVLIVAGPASVVLSSDPMVAMYARRFMRIAVLGVICEGIVVLLKNFYISLKKHRFVSIVNIFHCIVLHIVFSIVMSRILGVYGVMASYPLTEITMLIFMIVWGWRTNKRLHSLEDLLPIEQEMESYPHMMQNIYAVEEIRPFLEKIKAFCGQNGISNRRSFLMQLCCEEMLYNIFEHGFSKQPEKKGIIHVYIANTQDQGIELIIRDNGPLFDPSNVEKIFYPEQAEKNIGIRIVQKISDEFVWQNVIGMNTLNIRLGDKE